MSEIMSETYRGKNQCDTLQGKRSVLAVMNDTIVLWSLVVDAVDNNLDDRYLIQTSIRGRILVIWIRDVYTLPEETRILPGMRTHSSLTGPQRDPCWILPTPHRL